MSDDCPRPPEPSRFRELLNAAVHILRILRGTPVGRISALTVLSGLSIISQSWIEQFVAATWKLVFRTPLELPDVPSIVGFLLVLLGMSFLFGYNVWTSRAAQQKADVRSTVAIIHHDSMDLTTNPLPPPTLPSDLQNADIRQFPIDQTMLYHRGILNNPAAAIRMQMAILPSLRQLLAEVPEAAIIYHGKAHIPLVFLLGHTLSTGARVHLYELDRQRGNWWPIDEALQGDDLLLREERSEPIDGPADVVLRISISYPVHRSDVQDALQRPFSDIHIAIAQPRLDAVQTTDQLDSISRMFRHVLDDLQANYPSTERIHIFYSGPMSAAFSMGRQISATIHSPVLVYNFSAKSKPKYAWALHVNGPDQPESLIYSNA